MPSNLDPIKQFPCTYDWCFRSFDTLKEMIYHKRDEPDHFYCKKCDVDCEDWVSLTQHKVDAMAPWLEGKIKDRHASPRHICCEFCGEDFRCFGGRKAHRERLHRALQDLTCPGCEMHFVQAGLMIQHIERDQCGMISRFTFYTSIKQKYVVKQMMVDPSTFVENLNRNLDITPDGQPGLIKDNVSEVDHHESHMVEEATLLDEDSGEKYVEIEPLPPGRQAADTDGDARLIVTQLPASVVSERREDPIWPRLPSRAKHGSVSISSNVTPPASRSPERSVGIVSTSHGPASINTPDRLSPSPVTHIVSPTTSQMAQSSVTESAPATPSVWAIDSPKASLFLATKTTLPTQQLVSKDREVKEEASLEYTNLFERRFWDRGSMYYDVNIFFNKAMNKYLCPFPGCHVVPLDTSADIEYHLNLSHLNFEFRCPACLKIFKSVAGLIIDEITGGHLKVNYVSQPKLVRDQNDIMNVGEQSGGGIMKTKFTGKLPGKR